MTEIRSRVRAVIFGITGVIAAFLIFRIGLDLVGASSANSFVKFLFDISDFLMSPFSGLVEVGITGVQARLNFDAILALGVYVTSAIIFAEIVTAFLYDNVEDIVQNIVDGIFKFLEFILFLRIIFELFALTSRSVIPDFVNTIYGLTSWTQGILFDVPLGEGALDLSSIVVLVIIVILDITTEKLIRSIFEQRRKRIKVRQTVKKEKNLQELTQPIVVNQAPAPAAAPQQNITINLPMPQPNQPKKPLPEFVEYSDKTNPPKIEIKTATLDAEDPDPETNDKPKKKGLLNRITGK